MNKVLLASMLSGCMAVSAFSSFQDNTEDHFTKVELLVKHDQRVVDEIPAGSVMLFDPTKPVGQQLHLRVRGKRIQYFCPARPDIEGMVSERSMGVKTEYIVCHDTNPIELITPNPATYDGTQIPAGAGYYFLEGPVTLEEVKIGNVHKFRRRVTGTAIGFRLVLEYFESVHMPILREIDTLVGGGVAPAAPGAQAITISTWYQPNPNVMKDKDLLIYRLSWPAVEKGLENQRKEIALKINHPNGQPPFIALSYPCLEANTKDVMEPEYVDVPEMVKASRQDPVKWKSLNSAIARTYFLHGAIPGYTINRPSAPEEVFAIEVFTAFAYTNQWDSLWRQYAHSMDNPNFNISKLLKTIECEQPTGQMLRQPTGKTVKVGTETIYIMESIQRSSGALSSSPMLNIMLTLNIATRSISAYCNGERVLTIQHEGLFGLTTFDAPGHIEFGKDSVKIGDIIRVNGEHEPQEFGCYDSCSQWVPKYPAIGWRMHH